MLADLEHVATTPAAYALVAAFGLLWGSFANVCIYRWPAGRSVVRPGSHCSACQAPIKWYDNVPILAWLWLRGKCRACRAQFSARYLVVEALTGALFAVAWWATIDQAAWWGWGDPFDMRLVRFAITAAFCVVLVIITFIDLDHMLILDKLTLPSIAVFYGASLLLPERSWYDGLIGIAIGYGVPWLIGEIYYRLRGIEGLGLGDAKLLALIGALLGWRGVVIALFGGSVLGVVISLPILIVKRRRTRAASDTSTPTVMRTELPFGPFLVVAALFYAFAEPWLLVHFRLPGS
jgi:leader peptidase (prepilin peptidase)/N-methyltransferase